MLTLAAFIAFSEHCHVGGARGNVFKTFRQRSAGPLWAMFKKCAASTGQKWQIVPHLRELASADIAGDIDGAVSQVALTKHGKKADVDYSRLLQRIGNILSRAMSGRVFGYFEDIQRPRFSMNLFKGIFRNARGPFAAFIDVFEYEGKENFPSEFVFLFDVEKGQGLRLFPLIARGLDSSRSYHAETDFYVYDIV